RIRTQPGGGAAKLDLEAAAKLLRLRPRLRPRGARRVAPNDVLVLVKILLVLRRGVPGGCIDRAAGQRAVQSDFLRRIRRRGRRARRLTAADSGWRPG